MAAGEEYVAAITAAESDRAARRAFQNLAVSLAPPGDTVLDFGAGTGIDAKHYAASGLKVIAYDTDPRMCATFARYCAEQIAAGWITLYEDSYEDFLGARIPRIRNSHDVRLITANFAPFSLVDDLPRLFASLHALTAPGAKLLASVLNPLFVGDFKYRWWWRNRLRYWRDGEFHVQGTQNNIFRRSIRRIATLAQPYFALQQVMHGLPDAQDLPQQASGAWPLMSSRYIFLIFARV